MVRSLLSSQASEKSGNNGRQRRKKMPILPHGNEHFVIPVPDRHRVRDDRAKPHLAFRPGGFKTKR